MSFARALAAATVVVMAGCGAAAPPAGVEVLRPEVLEEIPHDVTAFTQGFEIAGGSLYEGTGRVGTSQLRELDPATGAVRRAVPLPGPVFGEGITVVGDRIWQLTWRDGIAIEWDRASFTVRREVPIEGEGWGLCLDGERLVRSDGTDRLRFHDPDTFAETGSVTVTLAGAPVPMLNELECVDGQVYANVFQTDRIVRIDPGTGVVTATVDAAGLLDDRRRAQADVLNGIAAAGPGELLLTGKYWPSTFRVRLVPA
ncbi:glutaminyl-peptide cyclotransferase [Pseudonocardia sp.]|uniref:glutaminyl-peptide cyclotransferase n=1 Tax=Pseudonocardia sp. TaxID=60912 RepID=UPI00261F79BF|nr:glutaminyl-peptide cyclotransferase [Pseudonocardia sp.]